MLLPLILDIDLFLVALADTYVLRAELPGAILAFHSLDMLDALDITLAYRAVVGSFLFLCFVKEGLFLGHL